MTTSTVYANASLVYGTDTNIRLIELLPKPAWYHGKKYQINCKFHVLSLASNPEYTAISYMWGEDSETSDIILGKKRFAVRKNLYSLLEQLSKTIRSLIWVDAICIDQGSIHERNHQVGLMGNIYSKAKDVIVWLGPHSADVCEALSILQLPSGRSDGSHITLDNPVGLVKDSTLLPSQRSTSVRRTIDQIQAGFTEGWKQTTRSLPLLGSLTSRKKPNALQTRESIADRADIIRLKRFHSESHYIRILCTQPYWSRAWIVQELLLARNVSLQCGSLCLESIDVLSDQLEVLHSQFDLKGSDHGDLNHLHRLLNSQAARLLAKRKIWQNSDGRSYINPWDTGFGHLGCSDVRDRVYAMLAMMDPKLGIVPDYHKTPSEIFKEIFEQHLKRNGSLTGTIWNLQRILEISEDDPTVQRSKEFGSLEWNPFYYQDK